MNKKDFDKIGDECFNQLKELNPKGGIKEFIRIAVEFGYKRAVKNNDCIADVVKSLTPEQTAKNATIKIALSAKTGYTSNETHKISPDQWFRIQNILNEDYS